MNDDDDEFELPAGYTWDFFRAEADRINAFWLRVDPGHPGVTPEHLAQCRREELAEEAREAAAWAALTPVEQAAMSALESAAEEETVLNIDIIQAAKARRPGVVTSRELREAMLPTDPDFAEVTAAMRRIVAISTMQDTV